MASFIGVIVSSPLLFAFTMALVALIGATLLMNRGRWWMVNVLAQKEAAVFAIGVFLVLVDTNMGELIDGFVLMVGAFMISLSLVARYTDLVDL